MMMILSVGDDDVHSMSTGPLYTEMLLPGWKRLMLQIDRVATVNVMLAKNVGSVKLMNLDIQLTMYMKATLKPLGKCRMPWNFK